ncbi:THAP domain-containing protein 1-like isoform X2 [Zophobas morio]|uniref:THAP domain-containing protein 1-like isoform X2 n=1 Tax=Zophobas morio TaxID=2755281 RepID=UPI0030830632
MSQDTPEVGITKCTVISCRNFYHLESPPDYQFFPFPTNRDISKKWKEKCGISAYHDVSKSSVCSDHFKPTDYADADQKTLTSSAIPTENLGWMLGMPEVKVVINPKAPKIKVAEDLDFNKVKEAVDVNEKLKDQLQDLVKEYEPIKEKMGLYKRKIDNVEKEINRVKMMIAKVKSKNWKPGNNLLCRVFSQAQINMLLGKKKVVWSYDDMAMAFTLRHVGNKECYLYLKDTLNLPLPALSAVQRWVASNKLKP